MLVYFDSCVLQRPWDDQSQDRVRDETEAFVGLVELVDDGEIEVIDSETLESEISKIRQLDRRTGLENMMKSAAVRVKIDAAVEGMAVGFQSAGIKKLDAFHLALAVRVPADVFCTTDDQLRKRGTVLLSPPPRILSPIDLYREFNP
ncbi:hypothetical protein BH11PLA2_BH11PLA2_11530 [soil metagenome]